MGANKHNIKSIKPSFVPILADIGPPCQSSPDILRIADSGCTSHVLPLNTPTINCFPAMAPITIANPNGTRMVSTHDAELNQPFLPLAARRAHIVPALQTKPLISIGQLCDAGCISELHRQGHSSTIQRQCCNDRMSHKSHKTLDVTVSANR